MTSANNQPNINPLPSMTPPLTPLDPIPQGRRQAVRKVNARIENVHRLYMTLEQEVGDAQLRNMTPNIHGTINRFERASFSLSEAIARLNAALRGERYRPETRDLPELSDETKRRWASYFADEENEILSLATGIDAIAARLPDGHGLNETVIRGDLERMEGHGLVTRSEIVTTGHEVYRLTSAGWAFADRHGRRRGGFRRWLRRKFEPIWVQVLAAASILANFLQIGDAALKALGITS